MDFNNIINRSENDFVTLYKTKSLEFRIYDRFTDEFYTSNAYPKERRTYHLFKNYKLNDTDLKNFLIKCY
jgi:hypothetical protein